MNKWTSVKDSLPENGDTRMKLTSNIADKKDIYCPIMDGREMHNKQCPCGWPEQHCIKEHKELRTDIPPEPSCVFDGETWRNA